MGQRMLLGGGGTHFLKPVSAPWIGPILSYAFLLFSLSLSKNNNSNTKLKTKTYQQINK